MRKAGAEREIRQAENGSPSWRLPRGHTIGAILADLDAETGSTTRVRWWRLCQPGGGRKCFRPARRGESDVASGEARRLNRRIGLGKVPIRA